MQKVKEFLIYVIIIVSLILGIKYKPLKNYTQPKELKDSIIILKN
jgi:hypothetical protein